MNETTDITAKRYRVLGGEDIYRGLRCGELYAFEVKYNPSTTNFIRYGTELISAGSTGTIAVSLTILVSFKINNVENYLIATGCKTDKIDIEVTADDMVVTQNFICKSISTPAAAHGLTSPTFAANFSGTPLCSPDTGANPFTFNSITFDTVRFHITWSRNLDARQVIGNAQVVFIVPTVRDIDVDFDVLLKETTQWADMKTLTARSATFQLNATGPKTITMTNLQLEGNKFDLDTDSKEVLMVSYSGFCSSATVTA